MPSPLVSGFSGSVPLRCSSALLHAVAVGVVGAVDHAVAVGVACAELERMWNSLRVRDARAVVCGRVASRSFGLSPTLALVVVRDAVAVGVGRSGRVKLGAGRELRGAVRRRRPAWAARAGECSWRRSPARWSRVESAEAQSPTKPPPPVAAPPCRRRRVPMPTDVSTVALLRRRCGPVRGVLLVAGLRRGRLGQAHVGVGNRLRQPGGPVLPTHERRSERAEARGCRRRGRPRSCPRTGGRRGPTGAQCAASWSKCCQCPTCLASPSVGTCRQVVRGPLALLGEIDPR